MGDFITLAAATLAVVAPAAATPIGPPMGPHVIQTIRNAPPALVVRNEEPLRLEVKGPVDPMSEGERLVRDLALDEPSNAVGAEIAAAFAASRGGQVRPRTLSAVERKRDLEAARGLADYVVDVQPVRLTAVYYPTERMRYGLTYAAKVRVFDVVRRKVVGRAECTVNRKPAVWFPKHHGLIAEDGGGLRVLIADATATCVAQMKARLKL